MPELPEVETVVRDLRAAGLEGRRIRAVHVYWPRMVTGLPPAEFARRLRAQKILHLRRRAKYILLSLSNGATLLVHLRMTGQLHFVRRGAPRDSHEHLVLALDDHRELRFHDTRKFGRWRLLANPESILGKLGPEPLSRDFRRDTFHAALRTHRRLLKPLLLDQAFVAGLGNIYADEVLWRARIHPCRSSSTIRPRESTALFHAIQTVLRRAVRCQGTSLGRGQTNFHSTGGKRGRHQERLEVFRRTGEPCPRCATPIVRLVVGQRSTHICPCCQKKTGDTPTQGASHERQ